MPLQRLRVMDIVEWGDAWGKRANLLLLGEAKFALVSDRI